ncbi:hypothetical protein FOIG_14031 [Fusarium odoratissimum NRRL 54006]|uniref:DUF7726 domain-containing protein n=1 Tax=Fusarium odoratissimum (strain NRRL 54006) TaxID=1089451 RepID=X0J934_FUSO5|nr:uncharacterized protein FOIG_14031 [Fusarium odoratissimum NRRL 54006]EXL92856.1 hypothetical protein FOIG_14031 [Fusarium odoratissimum NRRL 54006]
MPEPLVSLQPEVLNAMKAFTESIVKDKEAEVAALKDNATPKSPSAKKTTPASGKKRKAEFCRATGTNSKSLDKFLKQKDPFGGSNSAVWRNAYVWFQQRKVMGLKMPDAKKRQLEESKKDTVDGTPSNAAATKALPDISEIHLEGEETDVVPIYDGCDEIRRKINAHMKVTSVTQAQFCRDIYAQFNAPTCKGI